MANLTYRERRLLRYVGMPAATVAVAERMTVAEVLERRDGPELEWTGPPAPQIGRMRLLL